MPDPMTATEQTPRSGLRRRSLGLDIVRSAAILMVLLSHCGDMFDLWTGTSPWFYRSVAGFYGVELFFVLSGYLIGQLLLDILAEPPSLRALGTFLVRRWMRTLPLYYLCLAVLALIWPPRFWEGNHAALWHDLPWFAGLAQNLAWPMVDEWFGVTWSLTVEEWFYLLFSVCLLASAALLGRRRAFWLTLGAFLLIPAALRWLAPLDADMDSAIRKIALYRLDAIGFGVLLAWMTARKMRLLEYKRTLLAAGLGLLAASWLGGMHWLETLAGPRLWRVLLFDIASLSFALCLPAARALESAGRLISRPFQAISAQSYSLYLIHLSVLEMMGGYRITQSLPATARLCLALSLMWGLSYLSYRTIEAPILRLRPPQARGAGNKRPGLRPGPAGALRPQTPIT